MSDLDANWSEIEDAASYLLDAYKQGKSSREISLHLCVPQIVRWSCPLRACHWAREFPSASVARGHLLIGGIIREHIESHELLEWAQEVIDLNRAAPVPAPRYPDLVPREDQDADARRPAGPGAEVPATDVRAARETGDHD